LNLHRLHSSTTLPLPLAAVFPFFAEATNLERIMPPKLRFQVVSRGPIVIEKGTLIEYRFRKFGFPLTWLARINHWDPPHEFVDEQLRGPFKHWVHAHCFREEDGQTILEDDVVYSLPLSPLGDIAYPLVKRQVERIFEYREIAVRKIFS
jgi:ligand-binding SRPBCC domain-containing protein